MPKQRGSRHPVKALSALPHAKVAGAIEAVRASDASMSRPLCRLVRDDQHRGQAVSSTWIRADRAHHRTRLAVLDAALMAVLDHTPELRLLPEDVAQKPFRVPEREFRLAERGGHHNRLSSRYHQRPSDRGCRERRRERRLAVASSNRQRRLVVVHHAVDEPALKRHELERLAGARLRAHGAARG